MYYSHNCTYNSSSAIWFSCASHSRSEAPQQAYVCVCGRTRAEDRGICGSWGHRGWTLVSAMTETVAINKILRYSVWGHRLWRASVMMWRCKLQIEALWYKCSNVKEETVKDNAGRLICYKGSIISCCSVPFPWAFVESLTRGRAIHAVVVTWKSKNTFSKRRCSLSVP